MKSLLATILIAFFAIACIPYSFCQSEEIYAANLKAEDIPSADFRIEKPEALINEAKALALEKPDEAFLSANKALLIAQKLELPQWEAQSFRRMGVILLQNGDYPSALHYLHRGADIFESQVSTKNLRIIYNNLGVTYENLGEHQKAIDYYFKCLEQAEVEGNPAKQLAALSNLGGLSNKTKQYKSAKEFLQKGLALAKEVKDETLTVRMRSQLGTSFLELGELALAEKELLSAEEQLTSLGEKIAVEQAVDLADIYNDLGRISKEKKDIKLADEYYDKALMLYKETNSPKIVRGYSNLGSLAFLNKEYEKAIFYFQKALYHPEFATDDLLKKSLYLNLSLVYGKLNEPDLSSKYLYNFAYLTDSIYEAEMKESASRAELLYTQARSERREEEARLALEREKMLSNYLLGALAIASLLALVLYLFMRNYAQRKEALRQELAYKEESNKLMVVELLKDHEVENLNAMLDGQESERKRIARDLHDSLGGTLAAVQLTLASLRRKLPKMNEVAKKNYDKAENLLDQAYHQMRGISHNLVDLSLKDGGLSPALNQLQETLSENTHLDIHMNYKSLGSRRLDSNIEQHSYRITQELFQNIIKHADASNIEYELNYSPVKLQISIKDDGKGFTYEPGNKTSGIGLNNIMTRVRQLEGEMDIQTKPGEGTRIAVDIPLVLS